MKRTYELSNASSYFYMPGEKVCMYADLGLNERIDPEFLEKAAGLVLKRFPYFAVKADVNADGSRYVMTENEKPFRIVEKCGYIDIGSEEANDYLFTLSYYGNHLFAEAFHGLADGGGFSTVLRALLKAYFELKEGRTFDCANAKSVWEEPQEEEWADPMECLRTVHPEFHIRKQKTFEFSPDKIDNDHIKLYSFSVPEKVLIDYVKKYEGGVSGAIALTLARAIDCIEFENKLPVCIACPMDMRKLLGCAETLRNCTKSAAYTHSTALRSMSYEKQLSVLKGQMMLQTSEEHQLPRCVQDKQELEQLNELPTLEEKKRFFSEIKLKNEPIVSYLGRFDMGELNDRINSVAIYGKVGGRAGMQNVCLCFKGRCYVYSSYNLKSESYIRMFANEMHDFSDDCSPVVCVDYDAPAKESLVYKYIGKNGLQVNSLQYSPCARQVKYAVAAVHGFAGHKESSAIQKFAERLIDREKGSAVIAFDLPGHGADRESLSVSLCDRYIDEAAEYLRKNYEGAEHILYGTSFGGYLTLKYAMEHPGAFDKYILRCPAVYMGDTLKKKILTDDDRTTLRTGGTVEKGFDMKVTLDQSFLNELDAYVAAEKSCADMADRMLILQGMKDELVNWEDVKEFAERNGIKLILSEEADHRFLAGSTMAETIEDCIKFICGDEEEK